MDFNDLEARNELDRRREEERRLREENVWRERVRRVKSEMNEQQEEMLDCLTQMTTCFRLLLPDLEVEH